MSGLHPAAVRAARQRRPATSAHPQAARMASARAGRRGDRSVAQVRSDGGPWRGVVDGRPVGLDGHRVDGGSPVRRRGGGQQQHTGGGGPGQEAGPPPRLDDREDDGQREQHERLHGDRRPDAATPDRPDRDSDSARMANRSSPTATASSG